MWFLLVAVRLSFPSTCELAFRGGVRGALLRARSLPRGEAAAGGTRCFVKPELLVVLAIGA